MHADADNLAPIETATPAKVVEYTRPRCPSCDAPKPQTIHTDTAADGTAYRQSRCRKCGWPFLVIAH